MRCFLFILVLWCTLGSMPAFTREASCGPPAILKTLSKEEQCTLDRFFRFLVLQDSSSYVLFGDKAMSVASYCSPNSSNLVSSFFYGLRKSQAEIRAGCNIWVKYRSKFFLKNYLIFVEEADESTSIYVINKRAFLKTFNRYRELFCRVCCEKITGEMLLEQMEEKGAFPHEIINEELLGLLLGFGKTNSMLYAKQQKLYERLNEQNPESCICKIPSRRGFPEERSELDNITARLHPFKDPLNTCFRFMRFPCFMADFDDQETKELRKKYFQQRKEITKFYRNGNFLETTLQKLCSES